MKQAITCDELYRKFNLGRFGLNDIVCNWVHMCVDNHINTCMIVELKK